MNYSFNRFIERCIESAYGEIAGKIIDIYFDDDEWNVRYVVIKLIKELYNRKILISPINLKKFDTERRILKATLSAEEIRRCPGFESEKPVARKIEADFVRYMGWPVYWRSFKEAIPPVVTNDGVKSPLEVISNDEIKNHLRSLKEVQDYSIVANSSPIGSILDFIIDIKLWKVTAIILKSKDSKFRNKICLTTNLVDSIVFGKKELTLKIPINKVSEVSCSFKEIVKKD